MATDADLLAPLYSELKDIFYDTDPAEYLSHAEVIIPCLEEQGYDMNLHGNLEALIEAVYELGLEDGACQ